MSSLLKASEEVRSRHESLKKAAQKVKGDLEAICEQFEVQSVDNNNDPKAKKIWYLQKLYNILIVQEKLLDNRVGCTFRTNEHFNQIMSEIDRFEKLINEIDSKCNLDWATATGR